MPATVEATCLCGKSRETLELTSDLPVQTHTCSCDTCRHTTGVLYLSTIRLPQRPALADSLQAYASSNVLTRYFCGECGSHMLVSRGNHDWSLCSGAVDRLIDAEHTAIFHEDLTQHEFVGDTRDGGLAMCFAKSNPAAEVFFRSAVRNSIDLEQNPPPWPVIERTRAPTSVDLDTKLKASCHCGGVKFKISRPTPASKQCSSPWADLLVPYHLNKTASLTTNVKWWLCGQHKYLAGTCACRSCRLGSGVPIQTWAFVSKANLLSTSSGQKLDFDDCPDLKRFESSAGKFREFCSGCGATAFWHCEERPEVIDVSVGLLRATEGSRAETWLDWHTKRVSFKEQALDLQLAEHLEYGLSAIPSFSEDVSHVTPAYAPLTPYEEIRLLVLLPAFQYLEPLEGRLMKVKLNGCPPYEALSYVWGDSSKRGSILIEGKQVSITSNLDTALRHLRLCGQPRFLWVDAVSINQNDATERSLHVQYMKEVYSHSSYDVLWLGSDGSIIMKCLDAIRDMGNLMDDNGRRVSYSLTSTLEDALGAVFRDPPLWKRVWIMQEISAAPDVILVAGHETMSWKTVEDWLGTDQFIERYGMPDAFHAPYGHDFTARNMFNAKIAFPQILSHQRRILQGKSTSSLKSDRGSKAMDVLARFRYTNATDPRDKIYGLLGLMTGSESFVDADYDMSVADLYAQVTRRLIQENENLDLLCQGPWELGQSDAMHSYSRRTDLPSWVPDFSKPGESRIMFAQRQIFQADAGVSDILNPWVLENGHCLNLNGWSLDTLAFVGEEFDTTELYPGVNLQESILRWTPNRFLRHGLAKGVKFLEQYVQPNKEHELSSHMSDANAFECYWRTLMLDCYRYHDPLRRIPESDLETIGEVFEQMFTHKWKRDGNKQPFDCHSAGIHGIDIRCRHLIRMCSKWSFALTQSGRYCMAPQRARPGDQIVVFKGAKVPVVLRSAVASNGQQRWTWVGTCYVHRYMDGKVVEEQGEVGVKQWYVT